MKFGRTNIDKSSVFGLAIAAAIGAAAAEPVKHYVGSLISMIDAKLFRERIVYVDYPTWYDGDLEKLTVSIQPISEEPNFEIGTSFSSRYSTIYFTSEIPDEHFRIIASIKERNEYLLYISPSKAFLSPQYPLSHALPDRKSWKSAFLALAPEPLKGFSVEELVVDGTEWISIAEEEQRYWLQKNVTDESDEGRARLEEYFAATDFGPISGAAPPPWACAFLSWVIKRTTSASRVLPSESARCASWNEFGEPLSEPVVGAIALLISPVGHQTPNFAGFITDVQSDTITVLGGNVGNTIKSRKYSKARITAIRWPKEINSEEILIVAKTLFGEVRGGTALQIENVASVIMNRLHSNGFPDTYKDIVLQPHQFSAWKEGSPVRKSLEKLDYSSPELKRYISIAKKLVYGEIGDSTGGAVCFHSILLLSAPDRDNCRSVSATDGLNVFYRDDD